MLNSQLYFNWFIGVSFLALTVIVLACVIGGAQEGLPARNFSDVNSKNMVVDGDLTVTGTIDNQTSITYTELDGGEKDIVSESGNTEEVDVFIEDISKDTTLKLTKPKSKKKKVKIGIGKVPSKSSKSGEILKIEPGPDAQFCGPEKNTTGAVTAFKLVTKSAKDPNGSQMDFEWQDPFDCWSYSKKNITTYGDADAFDQELYTNVY